jgi:LemA protein
MSPLAWVGIAIAAILLIIVVFVIATYNKLVRSKINVEEGYSTMDVYLKKRYDLIPNLVETVKGYAGHEKETLEKVIKARNMAMTATNIEDKAKNENALTGTLKSLFALSESYPDLKANTNFVDLQNQLKAIETDIANARKYYNGVVKIYNQEIMVFPYNIIANFFKFTTKEMFAVDNQEERKNVKVEF